MQVATIMCRELYNYIRQKWGKLYYLLYAAFLMCNFLHKVHIICIEQVEIKQQIVHQQKKNIYKIVFLLEHAIYIRIIISFLVAKKKLIKTSIVVARYAWLRIKTCIIHPFGPEQYSKAQQNNFQCISTKSWNIEFGFPQQ